MKIAHIVSTFPPYKGGMGNVCFHEAEELANLGHQVTIFTPFNKSYFINGKVKIRYLKPFLKYGNTAFIPQIVFLLNKFDIIYLHWPFIGAEAILFWKKMSLIKKPLVIRYQMDLIDNGWRGKFFVFYNVLFLPLLINVADKILVSSFDYARHSKIRKYLKLKTKFAEVPLGVDTKEFLPQSKNIKLLKKYNLDANDKIILFVGSLDRAHYFKGLDILLKAVNRLQLKIQNLKLLVIGEGNLKFIYKKLSNDLAIAKNVVFIGQISNKDLPAYYNLADIFILPSTTSSEAFGLVSLEAMACAKPIIISNLPGPRTLVQNNGFIIKVANVNDLISKTILLLEDGDLRNKFGKISRKIVLEKYNWPIIAKQLSDIYSSILIQ